MSDIVLGIDLGTTNSVVAVADGGQARVLADADGKRLIPSVVSFPESGPVVVGEIARERRLVDAKNTVYAIKRLIGRPFDSPEVARAKQRFAFDLVEGENRGVRVDVRGAAYSLAEVSAYVLRECRRIAEQMLGEAVDKAVITVPANFNELQRSATKAAGKVAGLDVLRILNEPTAAAVAYGAGTQGAERIAVYDLGGGTFDITILDLDEDVFEVVATAGDTFLGGDDMDLLVAEMMSDAFREQHGIDPRDDRQAFERLRAAGEWVKCALSSDESASCTVSELLPSAAGGELDLDFALTRPELEDKILPLVNQSLRVCAEAIRLGGVERKQIDSVVLVGGSTRIPLVRRMVRNFFEQEPRSDIDPDLVVALGAAIQGYALSTRTPRDSLAIVPGPSKEDVEATLARKQAARAERPEQPAFAPAEQASDLDTSPSKPPPRPRPPSLPTLPEPSASARPPRRGTVEYDVQQIAPPPPPAPAPVAAREPTGFGSETTEELALDFEDLDDLLPPPASELHARGAAASPPTPPPPRPAPPAPIAPSPSSDTSDTTDDDIFSTPFDDMVADLPEHPRPPSPSPLVRSAPPPSPAAKAPAPVPVVQMADRPPPLLMDVTPHSLGIETVGGYAERIIKRNAPIPIEQTRIFTTAQDDQETVRVTVCQGESRRFPDNQPLGEIELSGLRRARRGEVRIEVTFMIDANGTLDVKATDVATGRRESIRINLLGGFDEEAMDAMRARQEATFG